jgi:flagellar biosynthesis/type III secretory pathway protein FliH
MEALIRSAALAEGVRQLGRRTASAPTAAAPAPAAPTSATMDIGRVREQLEQQYASMKRELAAQHAAAMAEVQDQAETLRARAAAEGRAEGRELGEAEGRKELDGQIARVAQLAAHLGRGRAQMVEEAEDLVVEVMFAALLKLLGQRLSEPDTVRAMVRAAIAAANDGESVTVGVHPDDYELIAHGQGLTSGNVSLVPNPDVVIGGCTVEGAKGTLDARLETQLGRLRSTLCATRAARAQAGDMV